MALDWVTRQLTGEPLDFDGEFFSLEKAWIVPAPQPRVPIQIGGRSEVIVRRTARFGDGWLGTWISPKRFAHVTAEIADRARELREEPDWSHGLQVWVGIDDDRDKASARLGHAMENFYRGTSFERFAPYSPAGTPADVADFLSQYVESGCKIFNIMPITDSVERGIDASAEIAARLNT